MIKKIISGGQTGTDRAALDVALKFGILHSDVVIILEQGLKILADADENSSVDFNPDTKWKPSKQPKTVDGAVDRLIDELSLKDKTSISNLGESIIYLSLFLFVLTKN